MLNKEVLSDAKEFDAGFFDGRGVSHLCKGPPQPLPCYCKAQEPRELSSGNVAVKTK